MNNGNISVRPRYDACRYEVAGTVANGNEVRRNLGLARSFEVTGRRQPHEIPNVLRAEGHTVGIITSSPGWYARAITTSFGIEYDVLVAYEDTAQHKPDPAPITKALGDVGYTGEGPAFYIGDDVSDFESAYHAGITFIGVAWGPFDSNHWI